MEMISVKLAEVIIDIQFRNTSVLESYLDFKTKERGKYHIYISEQRLEEERQVLSQRFPYRLFNDIELESNALYRELPKFLLREGVLLFHGVLLKIDDLGLVFTAPSGTGKSTHACLWTDVFPDRTCIINGDKPLLRLTKEGVIAYGSPWKGKEGIGNSQSVKLKSICYLQRGNKNEIAPVAWNSDSLSLFLRQSVITGSESLILDQIKWFRDASTFLTFYSMQCKISNDAVLLAYNAICQEK